ncbi:hypothetical protein D3C78_476030 [compost metagenome]
MGPVPAAGHRAADRHDVQGDHRRGGIMLLARAADRHDVQGDHRRGGIMLLARAADRHDVQGDHRRGGIMLLARAADRLDVQGGHRRGRGDLVLGARRASACGWAPGRRRARCPGWPPGGVGGSGTRVSGGRYLRQGSGLPTGTMFRVTTGGVGEIWCWAPGGPVPTAGPRAADRPALLIKAPR